MVSSGVDSSRLKVRRRIYRCALTRAASALAYSFCSSLSPGKKLLSVSYAGGVVRLFKSEVRHDY